MRWIDFNRSPLALRVVETSDKKQRLVAAFPVRVEAQSLIEDGTGMKLASIGFNFNAKNKVWTRKLSGVSISQVLEAFPNDAHLADMLATGVVINPASQAKREALSKANQDEYQTNNQDARKESASGSSIPPRESEDDGRDAGTELPGANEPSNTPSEERGRSSRRVDSPTGREAGEGDSENGGSGPGPARASEITDRATVEATAVTNDGSDDGTGSSDADTKPESKSRSLNATKSDEPQTSLFELSEPPSGEKKVEPVKELVSETPVFPEPSVTESHTASLKSESAPNYAPEQRGIDNKYLSKAARAEANMESLRTLNTINKEGRTATAAEMETLLAYSGWGGLLAELDKRHETIISEELLSNAGVSTAMESALTAYYTPNKLSSGVWDLLSKAGYKGGRALETSAGSGVYLNQRLTDLDERQSFTAIEMDHIAGSILKLTNPSADVRVSPFEKTALADSSFDLCIGNIPFGEIPVYDREIPGGLSIHNYFLLKSLRKTKPGGVVAIITSTHTLDSKNRAFRERVADQADLVSAIRLPSSAFKGAHTEALSDILIFEKRHEGQSQGGIPFVDLTSVDEDSYECSKMPVIEQSTFYEKSGTEKIYYPGDEVIKPINVAFASGNGGVVAGKIGVKTGRFKTSWQIDVVGDEDDITVALNKESHRLEDKLFNSIEDESLMEYAEGVSVSINLPRHHNVLVGSALIHEDKPYIIAEIYQDAEINTDTGAIKTTNKARLSPVKVAKSHLSKFKQLVEIRTTLKKQLSLEGNDAPIPEIDANRVILNSHYEGFVSKYGPINNKINRRLLKLDAEGPLLIGLEEYDDDTNTAVKADIFTKRVLDKPDSRGSASSLEEAVSICFGELGWIEEDRISELLGKPFADALAEEPGKVFYCPEDNEYQPRAKYLTGHVRAKLRNAETYHEKFGGIEANIKALKDVIPETITADRIGLGLDASWVPVRYIKQFMEEACMEHNADFSFSVTRLPTGALKVGLNSEPGGVLRNVIYDQLGTDDRPFKSLVETSSVNGSPKITRKVDDKTFVDKQATIDAQDKLKEVKALFREWIWNDPERTAELETIFNESANSMHYEVFDGVGFNPVGLSPNFIPRSHQSGLVMRALMTGNTLAAHCVGAGKTLEMAMLAMELKRTGQANKPFVSIPNHMLYQIVNEFLSAYPSAKVCMITNEDLKKDNRRAFLAKVSANDWDVVVLTHSVMKSLQMPADMQERMLFDEIAIYREALEGMEDQRSRRDIQKAIYRFEKDIENLLESGRRNDGITIDQTGCDAILIDEADEFKNLQLDAPVQIPGVTGASSGRAWDLYLKTRYIMEVQGAEKGVYFFTGTPIANSVAEEYTMERYLKPSTLRAAGINNFNDWLGLHGDVTTELEMMPEGGGYRMHNRLRGFKNVKPLLVRFRSFADIKMREDINLPTPSFEELNIVAPQTELQEKYFEWIGEEAIKLRSKDEDAKFDNILPILSRGRMSALSMRLIDQRIPPEKDTKLSMAVDNMLKFYKETSEDKGAQIVFCDVSTPASDKSYNAYDDVMGRLLDGGVPRNEIAYIHDCKKDEDKFGLFRKVRSGEVRFILGSTQKLGTGANIQERLFALHNLDAPWRPRDLEQRAGRIIRQGNIFADQDVDVKICNYTTEDSFDLFMWEQNKRKWKFITQIMRDPSSAPDEITEDGELNIAEVVAVTTKNPVIREKTEVDSETDELQRAKARHLATQSRKTYRISRMKEELERDREELAELTVMASLLKENIRSLPSGQLTVTIDETVSGFNDGPATWLSGKEAAKCLHNQAVNKTLFAGNAGKEIKLGSIWGLELTVYVPPKHQRSMASPCVVLRAGDSNVTFDIGDSPHGLLKRITNYIGDRLPTRIINLKGYIEANNSALEKRNAEGTAILPFPHEDRLTELLVRQAELSEMWSNYEEELAKERESKGPMVPWEEFIEDYLFDIGAEEDFIDVDFENITKLEIQGASLSPAAGELLC